MGNSVKKTTAKKIEAKEPEAQGTALEKYEHKPPASTERNPFERYADAADSSRIVGQMLKFSKGDYLVGRNAEEFEEDKLVAMVNEMVHGAIRWEDNKPVEQIMGRLADGFVPPDRSKLSHRDEDAWEVDPNGKPRDPWQIGLYLPMVSIDGGQVYTFTTTSDGGRRRCVGPLCREYGNHLRMHPDELPIVRLGQDSYMHPDRSIGKVKFPVFTIDKWVKADSYIAALAAAAATSRAALTDKSE